MNRNRKIIIGLVSLVGVLAYNWTHTGGLLASYVRPAFVGYIAATGIELAVVGLSLRIADLRRNASGARFQVATLAAVVVVSALANIAEGYAVKFGESLTSANIGRLDIVQAIVSLSATGLLSLVTFAIAEIVGGDIEQPAQQPAQWVATDLQAEQPTEIDAPSVPQVADSAVDASQSRQNGLYSDLEREPAQSDIQAEQPAYLRVVSDLHESQGDLQSYTFETQPLSGVVASDVRRLLEVAPDATNSAIADRVGCSRETVRKIRLQSVQA